MKKPITNSVQPEIIESIKDYYEDNLIDLGPLTGLNFRHFRYRLQNNSFYKVKEKIRNSSDLKKSLIENEPLDVYYSTALWLNPQIIGSKLDEDILKNIYLSCDLAFDIDVNEQVKNLQAAKLQAINIYDFLQSVNVDIRYIAFSGSKGFHIVSNDPWIEDIIEEDPRKREALAVEKRKELVLNAKTLGLLFDEKVTIDTRRIIRVPGTVNSKTGFVSTLLSRDELESDLETIFKSVHSVGSFAPRISQYLREMTDPSVYKISGFQGRLGVRPKPEQSICYSTFYTNNIPGTRLKIPILEYGSWVKFENVEANLRRIQEKYSLGDMLLFKDKNRYWVISLKALTRRRVEKILSASKSLNLNQSKKFGCTYTRVGKSIDLRGKIVQDEPSFIGLYEAELSGQVSRTHYDFFSSLGIIFPQKDLVKCGKSKEKLEIVHAIIE